MNAHPRIAEASRAVRAIARWRTEHDLTANQADVLVQVFEAGSISAAELSRRVGITTASMSRLLAVLDTGGWIMRGPDPHDARRATVQASRRLAIAMEGLLAELLADGGTPLITPITRLGDAWT